MKTSSFTEGATWPIPFCQMIFLLPACTPLAAYGSSEVDWGLAAGEEILVSLELSVDEMH